MLRPRGSLLPSTSIMRHRLLASQTMPMVSAYPVVRREVHQPHSLMSEHRFVSVHFLSSLPFPSATSNNTIMKVVDSERKQEQRQLNPPLSLVLPPHQQRPVTAWERVRYFPTNMMQLWNDYLRYQNILDAANTPRNAWTLREHVLVKINGDDVSSVVSNTSSKATASARIPRRQYQQMRQFQQDWQTVLPIVLLSAPPIIGYFPLIFAIVAPRQVLSRQFHNEYEIWTFGQLAYRQRQEHIKQLAESNVGKEILERLHEVMHEKSAEQTMDAAWPILDLSAMYAALFPEHGVHNILSRRHSRVSSLLACLPGRHGANLAWNDVPRKYLVQLAFANGLFQQYPNWMSKVMVGAAGSRQWLVRRLREIATAIRRDDVMLLEEGHDNYGCQSLTDLELLDACLMRGLPVSVSLDDMRVCLTNHLQMMKTWMDSPPLTPRNAEIELLFLLHATPLRTQLKQQLLRSIEE